MKHQGGYSPSDFALGRPVAHDHQHDSADQTNLLEKAEKG